MRYVKFTDNMTRRPRLRSAATNKKVGEINGI